MLFLVKNPVRKFLIIRLSSIGDIVLTSPVIRCIKQQIKDAEIHYLTKEQFLPVLEASPYIDKYFTIRVKIGEVLPCLKKEKYDHVIDLHKNFRSFGVRFFLRRPSSGFSKINIRKWLMVKFKFDRLPRIHLVDRYFEAVKNLGVINDGKGLDYFIPEKDEMEIKNLPEPFRNGYVGWVIGGKHKTKIFPEEKIVEACRTFKLPVILLGGNEDAETGRRIAESAGENIYNACGRLNINQSASLVRQADKVITNDTGLMHVAAAFRKEIFSLWGNTIPGFGMYPYMPGDENKSHILEVKNLSCRPCSKLGFDKCPKRHFKCMREIELNL